MSLFGKLFRSGAAAASVALGAGAALAQEPVSLPPAVLDVPDLGNQEPGVTPAAGFGRGGLFGNRGTQSCPSPYYPCTPATPCPVTGQPLTPGMPPGMPPDMGNPQQPGMPPNPPTPPAPPSLEGLGRGADVGPLVGLNGYIENAAPVTMARIRFDSGYNNNRPDRGEFFYAKCGCFRPQPGSNGVRLPEKNIDYQELSAYGEYAISQRFSAFFNIPIRFLNPTVNQNASGLSDVSFGAKYAFIYNRNRIVSLRMNFQAPSGSLSNGLGNANWWFEPGLLYLEQLNPNWQLFGELRFQMPLGTRSDFTGNVLRYGLGTSYVVAQGCWGYIAPVVETVGWTFLSGKELDPDLLAAVPAHGDTIVNAKFGVRIGIGAPALGTPYPTRSDIYIGYGRALTGAVLYKDLFRLEYRRFF
jgi:hypothetical protein